MTDDRAGGVPDEQLADWHPTGPGMGSWQISGEPVPWVRLVGTTEPPSREAET